jgi:hypothetical protein
MTVPALTVAGWPALPILTMVLGGLSSMVYRWLAGSAGQELHKINVSQDALRVASDFEGAITGLVFAVFMILMLNGFSERDQLVVNVLSLTCLALIIAGWIIPPMVARKLQGDASMAKSLQSSDTAGSGGASTFDQVVRQYDQLRDELETAFYGQFVAMNPAGVYAIGPNRKDAIARFRNDHGPGEIVTFHVGS